MYQQRVNSLGEALWPGLFLTLWLAYERCNQYVSKSKVLWVMSSNDDIGHIIILAEIINSENSVYLYRINENGTIGQTGMPEHKPNHSLPDEITLEVYPNPTNGTVRVNLNLPETADYSIEVLTIDGRKVASEQHRWNQGFAEWFWTDSQASSGTYIISIYNPHGLRTQRQFSLIR